MLARIQPCPDPGITLKYDEFIARSTARGHERSLSCARTERRDGAEIDIQFKAFPCISHWFDAVAIAAAWQSGLHVSAQVRWTSGHWSPGPPDSFHPESAAPEGSPRGSCPATPVLAPAAATEANEDWPWLSRRGLRAAGSPLPLPPTRAASTGCSPGMDKGEPE